MQKLVSFYRSDWHLPTAKKRAIQSATGIKEHLNEYLESGWIVTSMSPFGCGTGFSCCLTTPDPHPEILGYDMHTGGYLAVLLEEGNDIKHKIVTLHRADYESDKRDSHLGISQMEHLNEYFRDGWRAKEMKAMGAAAGQGATGGEIQGFLVVLLEKVQA